MSSPRGIALVLAVAFVALAAAIGILAPRASQRASEVEVAGVAHGTPLHPPKAAHDFVLQDGDGRPAHLVDRTYPITMLFFGYTHCPDACPLALAALGRAYRSLDATARARTRIVFVTVDPARDRPSVVRRYARAFDPHIVALTGAASALARAWEAYGVRVDAKTHEIGHGDTIYALDASPHVAYIYPPDTSAADLAADLRALTR